MKTKPINFKRTYMCAKITEQDINKKVILNGWINKIRNTGKIIFIDLRDISGIIQIIFDKSNINNKIFEKVYSLKNEFIISVEGYVRFRNGKPNKKIKTGKLEIYANYLYVLSKSKTLPFQIESNIDINENMRLKYRYLDLRRSNMQKNLIMRSKITYLFRKFLINKNFLEIETPILNKSTPEGARDYLVPSRIHPYNFYALPQSPQIFKQLLMCAGYEKYFQIAKCFRDEDLRINRQPEFTQVDMELSFVNSDDIINLNDNLLAFLFYNIFNIKIKIPIKRLTLNEAMNYYGTNKPDLRYGMKIINISNEIKNYNFNIFKKDFHDNIICGINVNGRCNISNNKFKKINKFIKQYNANYLLYIKIYNNNKLQSSFPKIINNSVINNIIKKMNGKIGDLLLFIVDKKDIVLNTLGALRIKFGKENNKFLKNKYNYSFVWITEFPLFKWSKQKKRFLSVHHPFTMPIENDIPLLDINPCSVKSQTYDIILNGNEIGGGSVRIHNKKLQEKIFNILGFDKIKMYNKFGFFLNAFEYGMPPHAGLAYGLDRLLMIMLNEKSIRNVIAFPKSKNASCIMSCTPNTISKKQLNELKLL